MVVESLFSYGTLQDPMVQTALLGKILPFQKAWILNWGLYMGADGYLFVKPLLGARVQGRILALATADLALIDLWENCDVYSRESCKAFSDETSFNDVWLYTRRAAQGEIFSGQGFHGKTRGELMEDIRAHMKTLGQA
ncbi:MAG: gamma-glutamylcyclotransferase [Proteobacteria bacterium]|nr:gamma-glutamylcyclotransferase [Pseudomonadota bacterium]